MEQQIDEILGFLRHSNIEVRKQAVQAFMQVSGDPKNAEFLRREDLVKALMASLYEIVSSYEYFEGRGKRGTLFRWVFGRQGSPIAQNF